MSQCGCDMCDQQRERTLNGVQVCSVLHVAHVVLCVLVLVGVSHATVVHGVSHATVVHIGHEDVVVVIQFCVAIFVVIFCIRRCTLYKHTPQDLRVAAFLFIFLFLKNLFVFLLAFVSFHFSDFFFCLRFFSFIL